MGTPYVALFRELKDISVKEGDGVSPYIRTFILQFLIHSPLSHPLQAREEFVDSVAVGLDFSLGGWVGDGVGEGG